MSTHFQSRRDLYVILGVARTATTDDLRRAYRQLARRLHPDTNPSPEADKQFAELAEAYDTLSDPVRRRRYDESISHPPASRGLGQRPNQRATTGRGPAKPGTSGADSTYFVSRFDAPYGPQRPLQSDAVGGTLQRSPLRGADVRFILTITLQEAAQGVARAVTIPRMEVCASCAGLGAAPGGRAASCPTCQGSGRMPGEGSSCRRCKGSGIIVDTPCRGCAGMGRVRGAPTFTVHIPVGVESGKVIRIKGEGDPGPKGGPRGELLVTVQIAPDPRFRRDGADIYHTLTISPAQAAIGGSFVVPTLYGDKTLHIPARTQAGQRFELRGQGMPRPGHFRKGDQIVTVHLIQ